MQRLMSNLHALAQIGRNEEGGIDRALGSEAYRESYQWLKRCWEAAGLTVHTDAAANLWAVLPGTQTLAPIAAGSHHDTVTNGGAYDGALGVLMATEAVQTMLDNGIKPRHPIAVVSFTGEETNPFGVSTFGSKVLSGRLGQEQLAKLQDKNGRTIQEIIRQLGGNLDNARKLNPGELFAFLECHIEQGTNLFEKDDPVAAVTCITGICREEIDVFGEANHVGTTKFSRRHDALLAAGELNLALERIAQETGVIATIGQMEAFPNSANIIPQWVDMTSDVRTCRPERLAAFQEAFGKAAAEIEARRGVRIVRTVNLDQPPMPMSSRVKEAMEAAIRESGSPLIELESMAGHDAANMARVTDAGMLFVQSIDGKSHCKEEFTEEKDIETAANIYLNTLLKLDEEG